MNNRSILSLPLVFLSFALIAQQNPLKQRMFRDLKLTNSITRSYGDSTCVFHVAVLDDPLKPELSRRYFWFHQGEMKNTQGHYTGKLLHGPYEKFNRDGTLLEKGTFDNGVKHGEWIAWYASGNILRHYRWNNGLRTGQFDVFDPQGNKTITGTFKRGVLNGKVYYFTNGSEVRTEKYRNGKLVKEKVKKTRESKKESTEKEQKKRRLFGKKKAATDSLTRPPVEKKSRRSGKKDTAPDQETQMQSRPASSDPLVSPPAGQVPVKSEPDKPKQRRKKKRQGETTSPGQ